MEQVGVSDVLALQMIFNSTNAICCSKSQPVSSAETDSKELIKWRVKQKSSLKLAVIHNLMCTDLIRPCIREYI